ncbi:protein translocase subunit SecD [Holospora obtusa F1]|uniref:Protein translocase subunit SecD n=1 Tax=Holospora obtusa F1 TaxID=1399147 RepID=W6TUU9_HOLOB|nr:protein translocase subunit SecD [Holospora obtusa]ETZ07532.1 protein translocase subunit SecD [Holospora obtusa F1]
MVYVSKLKITWLTFLVCVSLILVLPSFVSSNFIPKWMPYKKIVLGLDLQGGVHLVLEAQTQSLFKDQSNQYASRLKKAFLKEKIGYRNLSFDERGVSFELQSLRNLKDMEKITGSILGKDMERTIEGKKIRFLYSESFRKLLQKQALDRSVEVIRKRVDETGTVEPLIQIQGDKNIVLQIPGFQNPEQVKKKLNKTGKLNFYWVAEQKTSETWECKDREGRVYRLDKEIVLTGEDVASAKADYHVSEEGQSRPCVSLMLTTQGSHQFSDLTRQTGRVLAIVLDHIVLSAPKIQSHIPNGQAVITGNQTLEECQGLAGMIRSGSLPVDLTVLEEKIVGPGMGADSIQKGIVATFIAIGAVALLMWSFYGGFGTFAVIAVVFNLLFLLAILIAMNATLTLPGIAGMSITVGMAVDANVLVNERIKEELLLGRKLLPAIDSGYRRAMNSVIDSNLTTLIAVAVLFGLGSGPVRGFAVTMAIGIVTSMFTAVSMTRTMVSFWLQKFPTHSILI